VNGLRSGRICVILTTDVQIKQKLRFSPSDPGAAHEQAVSTGSLPFPMRIKTFGVTHVAIEGRSAG